MCAVYLLAGGLWLLMPFGNSSLCYKTDSGFFCWKRFGASGSFPARKTGERVERWLLRRAGEYSRVACCGERFPTDSYKQSNEGKQSARKDVEVSEASTCREKLTKVKFRVFLTWTEVRYCPKFPLSMRFPGWWVLLRCFCLNSYHAL